MNNERRYLEQEITLGVNFNLKVANLPSVYTAAWCWPLDTGRGAALVADPLLQGLKGPKWGVLLFCCAFLLLFSPCWAVAFGQNLSFEGVRVLKEVL